VRARDVPREEQRESLAERCSMDNRCGKFHKALGEKAHFSLSSKRSQAAYPFIQRHVAASVEVGISVAFVAV
jgi:hypothetical protein